MKMSGPNGDPEIRADEGLLEDEEDFNEQGEFYWDTWKLQIWGWIKILFYFIYLLYLTW